MADLNKVKVVDCEFSVRTSNVLTRLWGKDVTLQTVANVGEDYLKKIKGLGAKGMREIAEMVEHFRDLPPEIVAKQTIKKVTMYQTSDGTTFPTVDEAARYEARIEFISWCNENLYSGIDPEDVAEKVLDAWNVGRRQ